MSRTPDERLAELCRELNLDKATADAARALWMRVNSTLSLDDVQETTAWLACVVYLAGCRLLPADRDVRATAGDAATSASSTAAATTGSAAVPSGISIQSLLNQTELTAIAFFKHLSTFAAQANLRSTADDSSNERKIVTRHAHARLLEFYASLAVRRLYGQLFAIAFPARGSQTSSRNKLKEARRKIYQVGLNLVLLGRHYIPDCAFNFTASFRLVASVLRFCRDNALQLAESLPTRSQLLPNLCKQALNITEPERVSEAELQCENFYHAQFATFLQTADGVKLSIDRNDYFVSKDPKSSKRHVQLDVLYKDLTNCYDAYILKNAIVDERNPFKDITASTHRIPELTPIGRHYMQRLDIEGGHGVLSPGSQTFLAYEHFRAVVRKQKLVEAHVKGLKSGLVSKPLQELFHRCSESEDDRAELQQHVLSLAQDAVQQLLDASPDKDLARDRIEENGLGGFYLMLHGSVETKSKAETRKLLKNTTFLRTVMALSAELCVFPLDRPRIAFPWVLRVLEIDPCRFAAMTEIIVRRVTVLNRMQVRHVNFCRQRCVQRLAWERESNVWGKDVGAAFASCDGRIPAGPLTPLGIVARQTQTHLITLLRHVCTFYNDKILPQTCAVLAGQCCLHVLQHATSRVLCNGHADALALSSLFLASRLVVEATPISFKRLLRAYENESTLEAGITPDPEVGGSLCVGDTAEATIVDYYNQAFLPAIAATNFLPALQAHQSGERQLPTLASYAREEYQRHQPRQVAGLTTLRVRPLDPKRKRAREDVGVTYKFRATNRDRLERINRFIQSPGTFAEQVAGLRGSRRAAFQPASPRTPTRVLSMVRPMAGVEPLQSFDSTSYDESSEQDDSMADTDS